MRNLVLITSIIKTPSKPLSYAQRSVFTHEERFKQTKQTIDSVKKYIHESHILVIECSDLTSDEELYFKTNSNYFINLYSNETIRNDLHSSSKSLCEGTMTYHAIKYIMDQDLVFDNFIKISGRYWLTDKFDYNKFNNHDNITIKHINNDKNNVFTALYKLPKSHIDLFKSFLYNNFEKMRQCVGYEVLFAEFIKSCSNINIIVCPVIGLAGYVSVSGSYYEG